MSESGGRRIKRQINIDIESIRFCSPDLLERLRKIDRVRDYIDQRQREIDAFNAEHGTGPDSVVNGRRMTNIGVFREYVKAYLRQHPQIHTDEMTFLVRQLQPTAQGLPIEVYVFSREQRWAFYEGIQADIFDHLFAALPEFDLRPFQNPTGADIAQALRRAT
jgi:miniconductance mechanosensitive channel